MVKWTVTFALAFLLAQPADARNSRAGSKKKRQAGEAPVEKVEGRVVKVSDGDTITVLVEGDKQVKVRLYGIDAPEKSQPFGNACRELLASRVAGKQVRVQVRATDRYGRRVGVVHEPNGHAPNGPGPKEKDSDSLGVNLLQVKDGCAWHYRQYTKDASRDELARLDAAEREARTKRLRLWSEGGRGPKAPWEFRSEERALRSARRGSRGR